MNLVNEKVQHCDFGVGVITDIKDNKVWVQFDEKLGTKMFLYPEGFEKFLAVVNPEAENYIKEEVKAKQELLEIQQKEKEREAAELEEKRRTEAQATKKRSTTRTIKRKS